MKNRSLIAVIVLLVVIVAAAVAVYPSLAEKATEDTTANNSSETVSTTVKNTEMKDVKLFDAEGNEVYLSSLKGKPMILNFWATWCGYCVQEMPDFEEAYKTYGDEVQFLMVNTNDGIEKGESFIKNRSYTFPTYYDLEYSAAITYGISGIPRTIAIDKDGNIKYNRSGMIDAEALQDIINTIR